ncbi:MAG: hypothetical protein K2K42_01980, partial [Eubacterium sp.]|nr:hypothetical protein [Eubacterium sp.]
MKNTEKTTVGQIAPTIKKLLSFLLSITMLFSITAGIDISAYAATNANAKAIVDNICATNGYRPGVDNYNDCYAYASAFCNKMYGTAPGGTSGYTLTRPGSFYLVGQTTGTGVSASTLSALLSQALPGDVVQMKWYTNSNLTSSSQHTAIVYSADSTSFTILQDGASWSTIQKSTYNYSGYYTRWKGSGFGISLYRYSNYNAQFGGTSGSTNAPSNLSLKTNKKSYKLNETIYFTPSGTDVVGYTIGIDKFNESKNMYSRVYTSDIGNSFQYSFSQSGYYCAYVSAWNNYGLTNSGYVYFSVGIKPQVAELYSDKSAYKIGETIHFYPNSDCADAYTIGIDKLDSTTNKYTRVFTKDISGNFDYTISSAGEYSAYISAWNATGLTDSKTIYFSVGIVPQNPKVEISKSEYNKGDNITFTPSAKYADGYTIGIDKFNESTKSYSRVVTQDIFENYHYNNVQEGVY